MSDDNEIQSRLNRMDEAFCARMRAAIEAGLERAPIGVVTTPGTQTLNTFHQNPGCQPPRWATFS
jgi:hypothetical protein